jgi:hypothetical protein
MVGGVSSSGLLIIASVQTVLACVRGGELSNVGQVKSHQAGKTPVMISVDG